MCFVVEKKRYLGVICLLVLFTMVGCLGGRNIPRLPKDTPPLITGNGVIPAVGEAVTVVPWRNEVFRDTPVEEIAENEFLVNPDGYSADECSPRKLWWGEFNWNEGKKQGEREIRTLDPNKTYIVIEVDGLIKIVKYLMEHVWGVVQKFMSFNLWA